MNTEKWHHIIGDKQAYATLYTDYFKKFYNYGRKFTPDILLIEDSIQEVFLDIWNKKERMLDIESINSYLFSSFRYTLFNKLKQANKVVYHPEQTTEPEPEFSVDVMLMNKEINQDMQQKLQSALFALTARQREAIFLRFYEGLSYEEVAAVLNISVKATYKIMARSLQSLKENISLPLSFILLLLHLLKS